MSAIATAPRASHARVESYYQTVNEADLAARLLSIWEGTGHENVHRFALGIDPTGLPAPTSDEQRLDSICSCLMDCYRVSGNADAFALLFDLTRHPFLLAIQAKIKSHRRRIDSLDVLQEVFLNIYRYPNKFRFEQHNSFRNWGHRIVQNTIFASLKSDNRVARIAALNDADPTDTTVVSPDVAASNAESATQVDFAFLLFLNLYLRFYGDLNSREQRALQMVEVEHQSYRQVATALGEDLANTRMVIFRARRKIFRAMTQALASLDALRA